MVSQTSYSYNLIPRIKDNCHVNRSWQVILTETVLRLDCYTNWSHYEYSIVEMMSLCCLYKYVLYRQDIFWTLTANNSMKDIFSHLCSDSKELEDNVTRLGCTSDQSPTINFLFIELWHHTCPCFNFHHYEFFSYRSENLTLILERLNMIRAH
jgi:hypothetical protein